MAAAGLLGEPAQRRRPASFLTDGGSPLEYWEARVATRALALADGDAEDAAAIVLCEGRS